MNIPFGKPIIGDAEKQAVLDVIDSGILVHGPRINEFEEAFRQFTGAAAAVGVSNCTAGMHLYYFARGYKAGDEVIVSAQTHTATAHAAELAGAKTVFVDAEPVAGNINPALIEAAITEKTRAIAPVHYLGRPADMYAIKAIAAKHKLDILEDCALAIGSTIDGIHAGRFGHAGCFSFYPVKHMTTSEGGMFITEDPELAARVKHVRAFGVDRHVGERTVPGHYDVTALGFNYRMSEINAVIGTHQLNRVPGFLAARRENYHALRSHLQDIAELSVLDSDGDATHRGSHYCLSVILDDKTAPRRIDIINHCKAAGVGTSIYYPCPVPLMTYYREKYGFRKGQFPVAERISFHSIALPVGPHLNPDHMKVIAQTLKEAILCAKG